jgi:alkylated DNA repair protein (DNA oxidative demethylase)
VSKTKSSHDRSVSRYADVATLPQGFHYLAGYLNTAAQLALLSDVSEILGEAPLFEQKMPRTGAPLSVRMSNAGMFGWVTDRDGGYRYQALHPVTGKPWPRIPESLLKLWSEATAESQPPNLCLINYYDQDARLGLHQDRGDSSLDAPVVSVSLGDEATFVLGGLVRKDPIRRLELRTGDVIWFGGPSRLIFHGVERIRYGTSQLLKESGIAEGGRLNLTLRRIDRRPAGHRAGDT